MTRRLEGDERAFGASSAGMTLPPQTGANARDDRESAAPPDRVRQHCGGVDAVAERPKPCSGYRDECGRPGRNAVGHRIGQRFSGGDDRPVLEGVHKATGRPFVQIAGDPDQAVPHRDLGRDPQPETTRSAEKPGTGHGAGKTEHEGTV